MMNLYQPNRRRRGLLVATVSVIAILLFDIASGGLVRGVVRAGATTLQEFGENVLSPLGNSGIFSSRRALEAQNRSLREELLSLQILSAEHNAMKVENDALRVLVHLADRERGITAPIVSSFRASPYGTFIIGAGSVDGLMLGSIVMAGDTPGVVLGRITEVGTHTSLVTTLFAPNVTTEALVGGVPLVLAGRGGGNARAEAPRDAPIEIGDVVVSPVLGGRAIGVVGAVEKEETGASLTVYVELPVNLSALSFTYVVTS